MSRMSNPKAAKTAILSFAFVVANAASPPLSICFAMSPSPQTQEAAGQNTVTKSIGAIKAITGSTITLTPDSGSEVKVTVQGNTRIVRIAPGEKNLKNSVPIQLRDLQVGDRILVGGKASEDAKSIAASSIVVMKLLDVEARHQQELQDWQNRGLSGLVSGVDVPAGSVTISLSGRGGAKTVTVHTSKSTVIRRYPQDSVKFDNATPSVLQEIQPGDQLRARGSRSADGADLTAEEIVTGSFRNVAGTIRSVDTSAGIIRVQDLLSKKEVQVKVTAESQLHKFPAELAQSIAARLKRATAAAASGANSTTANGQGNSSDASSSGASYSGKGSGPRTGAAPDFQQMLNQMPALTLADLHKGDAVMILTTQGSPSGGGTAITLLSGVEPILEAAPGGSQMTMLSPWNLGGLAGDAASE